MRIFFFILIIGCQSCATRPYFAIENNSSSSITLELFYDTINLNQIVLNDLSYNTIQGEIYTEYFARESYDSLTKSIQENSNQKFVRNYLHDSIPFHYFVDRYFKIDNLDIGYSYKSDFPPYKLKLKDYYQSDSSLIEKIILDNVVTFFVPPNFAFFNPCQASGDLSCHVEESFPFNVSKINVIINPEKTIMLTPDNFMKKMKSKRVFNEKKSRVLTID